MLGCDLKSCSKFLRYNSRTVKSAGFSTKLKTNVLYITGADRLRCSDKLSNSLKRKAVVVILTHRFCSLHARFSM